MTRGQWILAGLLLVQVALIVVLRQPASATSTEPHALIPDLDTTTVTRIEVGAKDGKQLILGKARGEWEITTADGYPADGAKVREVLDKIKDATVRSPVVTSERYHESLEVTDEDAAARVSLYGSDDSSPIADILIGKTTIGGAHVRLTGEDEVYDVRDISPWQVRPDTATWMQSKLVDVPTDSVSRLAVRNEHGTFDLERLENGWQVVSPVDFEGKACASDKVDPIVRAISSMSAGGAAGRLDPPSQGLGDEATSVTLGYGDSSVTVRIGGPVPDKSGHVFVTRDGFGFAATQWESSLSSVRDAKLEELVE